MNLFVMRQKNKTKKQMNKTTKVAEVNKQISCSMKWQLKYAVQNHWYADL